MRRAIVILACLSLVVCAGCKKAEYDTFATLHGVVKDHSSAEPIAGVSVQLSPGGKTQTTGTDGRFEFVDLEPLQYTIQVQKDGYSTNTKTVTAVVGENNEVNISMTKLKPSHE